MRDVRCDEILTLQAHGLKKRLTHVNPKTVVLGLSGGLDSTLALLVCARAFDLWGAARERIICVTMPCFGTTGGTYANAKKLAAAIGATLREVPVFDAVNQHFKDIGHNPEKHDLTYENSQARERTQVLMDIASEMNGFVIGTGDLSELALGFATYNGDHMSMYGVNASIPKTLIRYLIAYAADAYDVPELGAVLKDVLNTPVSPELLPPEDGEIAQRTESILGPYEAHDFFLYYMMRLGHPPKKILYLAQIAFEDIYTKEQLTTWLTTFYRRFFSNQFKRSCLPDGAKVGSVALSPRGDWRMPSDAEVRCWLEDIQSEQ
jgi:NAD+ synthase (glutamine-hydrolysing)